MKVKHSWHRNHNADSELFKCESSYSIELTASERWELSSVLKTFIIAQKRASHECGVKLAQNIIDGLLNEPNPNVSFYKEEPEKLQAEHRELQKHDGP